jgi:hypothetical protein
MKEFIYFQASSTGRVATMVVGAAIILVGLLAVGGGAGLILAAIGLVPLIPGAIDVCILAPLAGLTMSGSRLREDH